MSFGAGGFGTGGFGVGLVDTKILDLVSGLPPYLPKSEDSGNYKLLSSPANMLIGLDNDVNAVYDASHVQTARTIQQAQKLAALVGTDPKADEKLNEYRARVLIDFMHATNEATAPEIITSVAGILGVSVDKIELVELAEPGVIELTLPAKAVTDLPIEGPVFATHLDEMIVAGGRVNISLQGTFTYITPDDYTNNNHDATKGYDGLDVNGDPIGDGGTYAGVLQ